MHRKIGYSRQSWESFVKILSRNHSLLEEDFAIIVFVV